MITQTKVASADTWHLWLIKNRLINTEPSLELQAAGPAKLCFILWKSLLHLAREKQVCGTKNGDLS